MGIVKAITEWATSPWGQNVPIHMVWFLIWVAAIAGVLFLIVHAIYVRYFAKAEEFAGSVPPTLEVLLLTRIPRHTLTERLFHWIMAAAMFTLLFTAFLPRIGVQFDWVTYHWIAGAVMTIPIIFHIIDASWGLDLWAIWPDQEDSWMHGEECAGLWAGRRRRRGAREIPAREQTLPWRDLGDWIGSDRNGCIHDVPGTYDLLPSESYTSRLSRANLCFMRIFFEPAARQLKEK